MGIAQAFRLSISAIMANKLRSFLTMLGVIIGVFAVVALVSLGQGSTSMVTEQVQAMGSNLLTVNITGRGAVRGLSLDETYRLTSHDGVSAVAPVKTGRVTVKYGSNTHTTSLEGVTPEFASVRNHDAETGRFIMAVDVEYRQNVAVLGTEVADELFDGIVPPGAEIRIDGTMFTVIGVLERKGSGMGGSNDNKIIIPLTTAQRLLKSVDITTIYVQTISENTVDRVMAGLTASLTQHFRDENAFRIFNQAEMLSMVDQVTGTLTLMLGGIASISLLVGGIGIMNIMLVSVTERTREIGVCKALGAKRRDILLQFLVESTVISGLGGMMGLLLSYGVIRLISRYTGLPAVFTPQVLALAVIFSLCVGVFFGIWPANKAAKLSPMEALRAQ